MEQTQLIELLRTLSPEERTQILHFEEFYFSNRTKVKAAVKILLQACLCSNVENGVQIISKEELFSTVFPDSPYSENKLEKTMVEAHKVARAFITTQHYFREENAFQTAYDYAEALRRRHLSSRYAVALMKLRKMQAELPKLHKLYYHNQYLLEYAEHDEESFNNQLKGDLNIGVTLDALDMHLYLNRLALLNVYLLQKKVSNIPSQALMQARIEQTNVPEIYLDSSPIIKINYTIFNLLKKEIYASNDLQKLFDLLLLHETSIDIETLSGFYTYLRNICNLALSQDPENDNIIKTLLALYQDNLERGFLHYEGKLHPSRYLGITELAMKAGQPLWALSFIEKYKHEITGENETHDLYRFNIAHHLFALGKYEECLDYIPSVSPYVDYLLNGKRLEVKVLYETSSNLLSFKMDAFKMFLSRTSQKIFSPTIRQNNQDFLNIVFQLCACIVGDTDRATKIRACLGIIFCMNLEFRNIDLAVCP